MNGQGLGFPLFPPRASVLADRVDALFFFLLALTGIVTLIVATLVIVFAVRYRRRPGSVIAPSQTAGSTLLELAWTIVHGPLFVVPFVWGARLYVDAAVPPPNALTITAIGKQWMWKFQHQGGQREIDSLHVPLGRPVRLSAGLAALQDVDRLRPHLEWVAEAGPRAIVSGEPADPPLAPE